MSPKEFNPLLNPYPISSNKFTFRGAYSHKLAFTKMKYTSRITRHQVFFLMYLIQGGFNKDFRTCDLVIDGLSWDLAKLFLVALKRIGYASKKGKLWSVTETGSRYYCDFMTEYKKINSAPFRWIY